MENFQQEVRKESIHRLNTWLCHQLFFSFKFSQSLVMGIHHGKWGYKDRLPGSC